MKGIYFPSQVSDKMIRAILEDRKTVTRRAVKPQPFEVKQDKNASCWCGHFVSESGKVLVDKPPYRPGDILYVRETWAPFYETMYSAPVIGYRYYSETNKEIKERLPEYLNWFWPGRWFPSIQMPREAARIFLRVTSVMVERLQDMKTSDFLSEGIYEHHVTSLWSTYLDLWNSTIKPADSARYGWEANPYVWVIEFERISKEEALKYDQH